MNRIIGLLTILTCVLFFFLGKDSVKIPRCGPMTKVKIWVVKELPKRQLPATGVSFSNQN